MVLPFAHDFSTQAFHLLGIVEEQVEPDEFGFRVRDLVSGANPLYRTGWYVRMVTPPASRVVLTRSRFTGLAPSLRKLLPEALRTG
jgi:hypothetical protein